MIKCILCKNIKTAKLHDLKLKKDNIEIRHIYHKCIICGCIFVDNSDLRSDLNKLYKSDYYVFNDDNVLKERARTDYYKYIEPQRKRWCKTLLEIGCAKGHLLNIARGDGWDVSGVEISQYASEYARRNYNLDIFTGEVEGNNLSKGYFDVICGFDVFEHVADPLSFLRCLKNLLSEKGIIILDSPNPYSIFCKLTKQYWCGFNPYHIQFFGYKTWFYAAEKCGLEINKVETEHYHVFSPTARFRLQKFSGIKGFNKIINVLNSIEHLKYISRLLFKNKLGDQWVVEFKKMIKEK